MLYRAIIGLLPDAKKMLASGKNYYELCLLARDDPSSLRGMFSYLIPYIEEAIKDFETTGYFNFHE